MPRKRADIAYRPCGGGCGRRLRGRMRLCWHCAPKCPCGQRARTGRTTCQACSDAGNADGIVWRKNRHGIYVAAR